uniref:ER membrane protein complex subunit 8 n=2 Tax=Nothobranchius kadleci TaxID=1051664 RepID=A0A1A8BVG8_NOTKA
MPIQLTSQAYCKMLLHTAKYPHCAVNGLLIAEKSKEKKKDGHGVPVLCVDCVPLFHGTLALAPMLEVALTLIDTWCKENNYIIAGYYQANERKKDSKPNQVAEKVAARITENFSEAAIVMVDNSRLTVSCSEPIVVIYDHHENKWRNREVTMYASDCAFPLDVQAFWTCHSAKCTLRLHFSPATFPEHVKLCSLDRAILKHSETFKIKVTSRFPVA